MTPARMAEIHAAAFAGRGQVWSEAEIAALLARASTDVVTAGEDGFMLVQVIPPEAEILTLAVDPRAQGRGLGMALVEMAVTHVVSKGTETLFLEVAEDNGAARALYAKTGFTETGRRKGYYTRTGEPDADALILSLALDAGKIGTVCKA